MSAGPTPFPWLALGSEICQPGSGAIVGEARNADDARLMAAAPKLLRLLQVAVRETRAALPPDERERFDAGGFASLWMAEARDTIAEHREHPAAF